MGRQKHCVHKLFSKHVDEGLVVKVQCNFCQWVERKNTTRIIQHPKHFCKIPPVKVKWKMFTETLCELMDDHDEEIADNKTGEGNVKIPNALNHYKESTTVKRKVNDPVNKYIYRKIPEEL